MRLPKTSATNLFLLDAKRKYINFAQANPSSLLALGVLNRANDTYFTQTTALAQPAWSVNALLGTYAARNNPGAQVPETTVGVEGLTFNGTAQYLEYDTLATNFSGTETAFTVVSLASCSAPSTGTNTVWSAAATGASTPILSLHATGGNIVFTEVSSGGTITATAATDTSPHVVTCIRTGTNIIIRVDGVVAATTAISSPASQTYNTFCVGSQNSNGSNGSFFTGSIGTVSMYLGSADIKAVEAYLLLAYGLQRGNVLNS